MHIFITGATGFIGRALVQRATAGGHQITVLTRRPEVARTQFGTSIGIIDAIHHLPSIAPIDAVVNLAGAPILDRRWSAARKKLLWDSRVTLTQHLVTQLGDLAQPPAVLVSGSAVGVYGHQGDTLLHEDTPAVTHDFGDALCAGWEQAASAATSLGTRVTILRTAPVLGPGGLLRRMLPAFKLGLGGPLGNGAQWMSWIHRDDLVSLLLWLLDTPTAAGIYNGAAPNPVTNRTFTRTLAQLLHRPAVLPVPAWALRGVLGEMSSVLLGSQRVVPTRALAQGFEFRYPTLEVALAAALSEPA